MTQTGPTRGSVLVTGGAGYIGAHVAKLLSERGLRPVVFDDLSAGHRQAVLWGDLVQGDVRDGGALAEAMRVHGVTSVIHLAALSDVAESVAKPQLYQEHNVGGTAAVLEAMAASGVARIVFSSSASVYGEQAPGSGPLGEDLPKAPVSPYGQTKLAAERLIAEKCAAHGMTGVALRYFNAAGADPSGVIGEAHQPETHLIPLAIATALGRRGPLTVFGADFETPDGSCLRDYVHVNDVARAHVAALELDLASGAFEAVNVGAGEGRSVIEVAAMVEQLVGAPVARTIGPRRPGDPASAVADTRRAADLLGWRPQASFEEIVRDAVAWARRPRYGAGA